MNEPGTRAPRFAGRVVRMIAAVAMAAGLAGGMALASQGSATAAPTPAAKSAPAAATRIAPQVLRPCWKGTARSWEPPGFHFVWWPWFKFEWAPGQWVRKT